MSDWSTEALKEWRGDHPSRHTTACLGRKVDAFCDALPEPGCTCDGAKVEAPNATDAHDEYPPCPTCSDPIDYCLGHGSMP